jgi:hypothetical protein
MIWIVRGTDRKSNLPRELRIDAISEQDARFRAGVGIAISSITPLEPHAHAPVLAYNQQPKRRIDRSYSLWRDPWLPGSALAATALRFAAGATPDPMYETTTERAVEHIATALVEFGLLYLIAVGITFVIWHLAGRQRIVARSVFIPIVLILGVIVTVASHINAAIQNQRNAQIRATMTAWVESPSPAKASLEQFERERKALPIVQNAVDALSADLKEARIDYERRTQRLEVVILDDSDFADRAHLISFQTRVAQLRTALDQFQTRTNELLEGFRVRMCDPSIPQTTKIERIKLFAIMQPAYLGYWQEQAEADRKIYDEFDQLVAFMNSHLDSSTPAGLVRLPASDQSKYALHIKRLAQLREYKAGALTRSIAREELFKQNLIERLTESVKPLNQKG